MVRFCRGYRATMSRTRTRTLLPCARLDREEKCRGRGERRAYVIGALAAFSSAGMKLLESKGGEEVVELEVAHTRTRFLSDSAHLKKPPLNLTRTREGGEMRNTGRGEKGRIK